MSEFGIGRARVLAGGRPSAASSSSAFQAAASRKLFGWNDGRLPTPDMFNFYHGHGSRAGARGMAFASASTQSAVKQLAQGKGIRRGAARHCDMPAAAAETVVQGDDDELNRMLRQFQRETGGGSDDGSGGGQSRGTGLATDRAGGGPAAFSSSSASWSSAAAAATAKGGADDREATITSFAERARARRADAESAASADAHVAYEARWNDFVAQPPPVLALDNIPWPPAPPAALAPTSAAAAAAARTAHVAMPPLPRTAMEAVGDLVGLPPTAPEAQLKAALRTASLRWHPDKFNQAFGARLPTDAALRHAILDRVSATMQRVSETKARWQQWLSDERARRPLGCLG